MTTSTTQSRERQPDPGDHQDPNAGAYRIMCTLVGLLGLALPAVLILGDLWFVDGGARARDSLSAYYHTGMRDFWVGAVCVIGFLLATYQAGNRSSWPFRLSLVAGIAALGVAWFPTHRQVADGAPACGPDANPQPADCSAIQTELGEDRVQWLHFGSAVVFIACLAAMSYLFGRYARTRAASLHYLCAGLIAGFAGLIVLGRVVEFEILGLTTLYVGEVGCVVAFSVSWLINGVDLRPQVLRERLGRTTSHPA